MKNGKQPMKTKTPQLAKIELEKASVEQINENTILLKFKEDVNFELRDAIEVNKVVYSIMKGKPFLSLVDAQVYGHISTEARAFFAKDILTKDSRIAEAFVINNLSTRLFVRFYMQFNKASNPMKIFSDIDDAQIWLNLKFKNKFGTVTIAESKYVSNFAAN